MNRCVVCNEPIDPCRIMAVLNLTGNPPDTCLAHSTKSRPVGYTVYGHKTAGDVVFLQNPTPEQKRIMRREYRRSR